MDVLLWKRNADERKPIREISFSTFSSAISNMQEEQTIPYTCHAFVCTNDRRGERKSCADGDSPSIQAMMKDEVKNRGLSGLARVSQSGCMGLCAKGPNVVLYPQKVWFSSVAKPDVPEILAKIAREVSP